MEEFNELLEKYHDTCIELDRVRTELEDQTMYMDLNQYNSAITAFLESYNNLENYVQKLHNRVTELETETDKLKEYFIDMGVLSDM